MIRCLVTRTLCFCITLVRLSEKTRLLSSLIQLKRDHIIANTDSAMQIVSRLDNISVLEKQLFINKPTVVQLIS